ncbi:hypothetical protein JOB18_000407 [Solea senegalensis]|uniref:Kisspeptin 1 n=1 Tax=Solea senegalensis TaxID=28829 RepID=A0AAV6QLV8_SOLSE|nr:hypothetical protein JOB18_000407 [Solea senegalensis]KAG7493051.1 hypothetical protein JOB18_000407 [Solea senegalensis]
MMLRLVALMMAAFSTTIYSSSSLKSTHFSKDQAILKALRDLSHTSMPMPSTKHSGNLPDGKIHSNDGKFPRIGWWIPKLALPQTIKKHHKVSSYNHNSFGLRYGK